MTYLVAELMDSTLMTQLAAFGAVAAVAWLLLDLVSRGKPRAEQRLDEYRDPASSKSNLRVSHMAECCFSSTRFSGQNGTPLFIPNRRDDAA